MRALLARLRDLFRRPAIRRAFDEEMSFHLAELERLNRARGMSGEDARVAARREFGNVLSAREDLRARAGFPAWDEFLADCRYAVRSLRRRPWLSVSVVLILALGLGAAATVHGLVDAVFLRPLPVPHPEELQAVTGAGPDGQDLDRLSRGTVRRLEAALPEKSVAAYGSANRVVMRISTPTAVSGKIRLVTGGFFPTLGVAMSAGRELAPSDDSAGAPAVAVASAAWARKNFGTPEAAVGREISLNQTPVTIVGVLPPAFHDVAVGEGTELWLATALQLKLRLYGNSSESVGDDRPNDPDWNREERISWLQILVRVRAGDPVAAALQRAWEPERDDLIRSEDDTQGRERLRHRAWQLAPAPGGQSGLRNSFRTTSRLLGGVVAVMLALVCSNVSGLLLVRAMARHREIGVRLALGAGSWRVVRLGLMEALLLGALGAVAGLILAGWLLPVAAHLLLPGEDLVVGIDSHSIALMALLAVGCAGASALAPSVWISRLEPLRALTGSRGLGRAPVRLGRILVMVQFGIAVALVAFATAMGRELQRTLAADPGFNREHVVTAIFDPVSAGYDEQRVFPLLDRLQGAALGVPGVDGIGFSYSGILAGSQWSSGINVRDPGALIHQRSVQHDAVLSGFFGVVGTPLLLGRDFALSDQADSRRVAVVNASFARLFFGDRNPIGQSFGYDIHASKDDWVIVGVVADMHVNKVRGEAPPLYFTPVAQSGGVVPQFLAVRFSGPEGAVVTGLRDALTRVEPGLDFTGWKTLEQRINENLRGTVVSTQLAGIFGGCAVLLAGAGVAGALGYLVVLRQRELAMRIAIGAEPSQLFRGVVADALRLSILGGVFGVAAAWLVPRIPVVREVLAAEPGFFPTIAAAGIALATALLAGSIPARRAARTDPLQILKAE